MSVRSKVDPQVAAHLEWLGYVQPTGLVVSAPALVRAGAVLERRDAEGQRLLRSCVEECELAPGDGASPWIPDFRAFAETVLRWSFSPVGYAGMEDCPIPAELEVTLTDFDETLRPDFAVRELEPGEGGASWQLLIRELESGEDMDRVVRGPGGLEASPHGRMERLLRQTGVPAGLLFNGRALRLVSAPRGESSGWMDFRVADMVLTSGRPICTALRLLLNEQRLLALPREQRLAALLEDSRKYQNEVSERLAEQVLHALYEFLRGLQAAHDASGQELLRQQLRDVHSANEVYHALLTVVLRLVFLLYAEERDMLPQDEAFERYYSLGGLHERLREDAALHPDTMDQRYGAWAQLLALFRMIHDGAHFGATTLPARHGVLFDPDRFPFLEGRPSAGVRQKDERLEPPLMPDGTVYRALENLLILDGERISYRALDVEQIGSVYETMMGFRIESAEGRSVAIRSKKTHGAPTTISLDALLAEASERRKKWLEKAADRSVSATVARELRGAATVEDLHDALHTIIDAHATPDLVRPGAMILQPSEERRRSGSHYTPRSLTEPIVRTTLEPILDRLRGEDDAPPTPEQILDLKVCDPAMGSGAFLVETCRQLGDALLEAWEVHGGRPDLPPDEDVVVFARRLIAKQCLYGVDRNPVAVDLAKVSLWLVTLAREHALTFVDHALRHGDSLVGLTLAQIEALRWDDKGRAFASLHVHDHLNRIETLRERIRLAGDDVSDTELRAWWREAEDEIDAVRLYGDLVLAAFFSGSKAKDRETKRATYADVIQRGEAADYRGWLQEWRHADQPLASFHWELGFPEVFERSNPGFDAFVGNPPFAGKNTIAAANVESYLDWLRQVHKESHGNADLVAHFFRRAFNLLRLDGALGLIATNTIAQGDTRATGLRWICAHGGHIFHVRRRVKWPGAAAVVVSVIHIAKGPVVHASILDGREVDTITAFFFHRGGHQDPARLVANAGKSFVGSYVLGMGFTFDDTDTKGVATPIAEMERLVREDSANAEVIFPYIGGEEVNANPIHAHHRFVINFGERGEDECWRRWPKLMAIVEEKVRPERMRNNREAYRRYWWQYGEKRVDLCHAIAELERVLAIPRVSQYASFTLLSAAVFSEQLIVFPFESAAAFCALQARPHEVWARFFGSTLGDALRYTPSDCFETFPFPRGWETRPALEAAGEAYYTFRADLMVRNDEGLTRTYNRFHDPYEGDPDIIRLRELHDDMDRAVLHAYGWGDIPTACEFLLDYEIDEEEWGRKKKPYRYCWPDEVRDEVLARLLQLNAERAAEEARAGAGANKKRRPSAEADQRGLF